MSAAKEVEVSSNENFMADFIREAELCKLLKKHPRTIHRWHVLRQGPPRIVIGRSIMYRKSSVLDWLTSREQRTRRGR